VISCSFAILVWKSSQVIVWSFTSSAAGAWKLTPYVFVVGAIGSGTVKAISFIFPGVF